VLLKVVWALTCRRQAAWPQEGMAEGEVGEAVILLCLRRHSFTAT
jgi:hypothetical protein